MVWPGELKKVAFWNIRLRSFSKSLSDEYPLVIEGGTLDIVVGLDANSNVFQSLCSIVVRSMGFLMTTWYVAADCGTLLMKLLQYVLLTRRSRIPIPTRTSSSGLSSIGSTSITDEVEAGDAASTVEPDGTPSAP